MFGIIIQPQKEINFRPEYEAYADKIEFMGTGKNEGIAFCPEPDVNRLQGNGYTHLLTMDQDSSFVDFSKVQDIIRNPAYLLFART